MDDQGIEDAAILLISMGEEEAAEVFRHLSPKEAQRLGEKMARTRMIPRDRYEFQMLYGIRRDLQLALARKGYTMRVYVPYGTAWYGYFMRRLAERPANTIFFLRALVGQ